MPKLNVQQNNQNVIQAFKNALAIGNLKGIIASDGSHNFSTAGSNRNLLDNPWWGSGEVVNQRGVTAKPSNNQYGIDRWIVDSGADANTMAFGTSGITFTISASSIWNTQRTKNPSAWSGKTLTASVLLSDGTIKSGTAAFTLGTNTVFYTDNALTLSLNTSGYFVVAVKASQTIRAVKLELGSVSTLANDAPPNYAEELAKCKYYFRRITNIGRGRLFIGVGFSGGVEVPNIFGVGNEMRKTTSLAVTYSGSFVVSAGTDIAVTGISRNENNSNFGLSFAASGITPYSLYSILGSAGAYIDISADL